MDIRIELLLLDRGIEAFEAVLLEGLQQDGVGHLEAVVQGDEIVVFGHEFVGGHGGEGAVEVVD